MLGFELTSGFTNHQQPQFLLGLMLTSYKQKNNRFVQCLRVEYQQILHVGHGQQANP